MDEIRSDWRGRARKAWPVAAIAVASALVAVGLSRLVFPFLSINNDEPINRFFAEAIADGVLFPPTFDLPDAFRPWLAAVRGDHFVMKYTPVVQSMMAASLLLTGGFSLYLGLLAAALTAMTYLLARELLGNRREALLACALFAFSPLVLVQSALLLSYLPTLLLLEVFVWGLLRGLRHDPRWPLALSGLCFGLAFFARSYDALVFGAPFLIWALLGRMGRRPGIRDAAAFSTPAAIVGALFLLFNRAATGDMLTPPFFLLEPDDTLGFGTRRLYPTDTPRAFGLRQGLSGVFWHGMLLNAWVAGGTLLLMLAAVTLVRRRFDPHVWPLVAVAFLLPFSYVFFWGPWNASVLWGGSRYVGPFYFVPVLLPVAVLGARALLDLHRWRPRAAIGAGIAIVLLSGAVMSRVISDNIAFTADQRALHELVSSRPADALVFAGLPTPFLMHPAAVISNRWDLANDPLYAVDQGLSNWEVLERFPERTPYRLQLAANFSEPRQPFNARLDELNLAAGETVEMRLRSRTTLPSSTVTVVVSALGVTREFAIAEPAGPLDETVVLDFRGAGLKGRQPSVDITQSGEAALDVELFTETQDGSPGTSLGKVQAPLRLAGGRLEVLVPTGRTWVHGSMPAGPLELSVRQ
ncbi:MAG TPA: glycosyltransferase family 39 protein [Actinomycetota bacterium]|nr:glycosyltransferase family 39 protein [Actinomycetota bacterium]